VDYYLLTVSYPPVKIVMSPAGLPIARQEILT
jgi:hypothetical protein